MLSKRPYGVTPQKMSSIDEIAAGTIQLFGLARLPDGHYGAFGL